LQFQGVFSVLPTPFNDDGSLDLESLKKVVDLYLSAGINGVTALGVTGEVARLNDRERNVVLETVIKQVNGRGAVIAGTSADGLHKCIEYSREARAAGASGVMTGFAYPEILVEVVRAFKAGDVDRASNAFYPFVSLMRFEFQEGIGMAIRKEVLRRRGAIKSSAIRAPGAVLDRATTEALDRQLRWIKANGGAAWISG